MATALASVAQLVGQHPAGRKVASSIPDQGTCLGCGFSRGQSAHKTWPVDVSLPPLKISKIVLKGGGGGNTHG